jgi:hypothetical protein
LLSALYSLERYLYNAPISAYIGHNTSVKLTLGCATPSQMYKVHNQQYPQCIINPLSDLSLMAQLNGDGVRLCSSTAAFGLGFAAKSNVDAK